MARRNIDRQALRQQIQELDIDSELKSQLLQAVSEQKKYGLVWEDHKEEAEEELREKLPVLVEQKDKAIISSPRGTSKRSAAEGKANCQEGASPNHILIEGDNLHALTALTYTHEGKVDVIYIDPPYNTGNKDFVYNDSFVDSEDGYRHSKWLSFMEKRLRIAKRLLSDRGVIFISIDDNEQANLKLLCDEVFGENNHITNFVWKSTPGSNTGNEIKTVTEYICLYAKNKPMFRANTKRIADENKYVLHDEYKERRGNYVLNKLDRRMTGSHYSDALNFPIQMPDKSILYPGSSMGKQEHWNWRWSSQKIQWGIDNGFIVFKQTKGTWAVYFKQYQYVNNNDEIIERTLPYQNLLDDDDSFNSARGSADLINILNAKMFDYPKPMTLVKRCLEISSAKHSIILDFFAGSGTTLHATMQLNAEDGGKRQCILVTNNENNICEEVTYERNKRVIQGYTTPKGVEVTGLTGNNLRYYKTQFIGREQTSANKAELMRLSIDMLCIKENTYDEVPFVVDGKRMKSQFVSCFENEEKQIIVVFDPRAVAFVAKALAGIKNSKRMKVFVYSDGQYAYNDEFRGVDVELCALPDAIYQAYRTVLPKRSMVVENMEIDNAAADEAIANAYDYRTEEGGNE